VSASASSPILPGRRIGVLGGGQLGRMFAFAAARMGYRVTALDPNPDAPAMQVAHDTIVADYDDPQAIERMVSQVEALTVEFENVPAQALAIAQQHVPVRPSEHVLAVAQDRALEKSTLSKLGLPVAPHAVVRNEADLARAASAVAFPAILKTARSGYDGHGQRPVGSAAELNEAWTSIGSCDAVLEQRLSFECELSVVGARGPSGEVAVYEPTRNDHANHILDVSVCPSGLSAQVVDDARAAARRILEGLDVVGVLCVEFFLLEDGGLVVNEIAPRPHNSGHLTIEAHHCCQFEQQVRALCGLPLGTTERRVAAAAMANLLGDLWDGGEPDWTVAAKVPRAHLHLYGKNEARPGRKMGHLTVVGEAGPEVERLARQVRSDLARGPDSARTREPAIKGSHS